MKTPISIFLDPHQFTLLKNLYQAQVVMIGNTLIFNSDTVIFHSYDKYLNVISDELIIRHGIWQEIQYSNTVGTMILFLTGYNEFMEVVTLGLSGVRKSDKLD